MLHMWWFFFFQAEDGIRDLVRSRGLGDVYKRQGEPGRGTRQCAPANDVLQVGLAVDPGVGCRRRRAVSYTHLTLPTSDLV